MGRALRAHMRVHACVLAPVRCMRLLSSPRTRLSHLPHIGCLPACARAQERRGHELRQRRRAAGEGACAARVRVHYACCWCDDGSHTSLVHDMPPRGTWHVPPCAGSRLHVCAPCCVVQYNLYCTALSRGCAPPCALSAPEPRPAPAPAAAHPTHARTPTHTHPHTRRSTSCPARTRRAACTACAAPSACCSATSAQVGGAGALHGVGCVWAVWQNTCCINTLAVWRPCGAATGGGAGAPHSSTQPHRSMLACCPVAWRARPTPFPPPPHTHPSQRLDG